jgi:hypothetical protein
MGEPEARSQTFRRGAKTMLLIGQFLLFDLVSEILDLFWWLK